MGTPVRVLRLGPLWWQTRKSKNLKVCRGWQLTFQLISGLRSAICFRVRRDTNDGIELATNRK